MKEILGVAAVLCELVSAIIYFHDIYRGNTKPHLYTMVIWTILAGIVFFGSLVAGAGAGAWGTGASFLFCASLIVISLYRGTTDITKMDGFFLAASLTAVVPWIFTRDPLWSVVLASVIDALGMVPTLRKTWNTPSSESMPAWYLAVTRSILQLFALHTYNVTTMIYIIEVLIADSLLLATIIVRRPKRH